MRRAQKGGDRGENSLPVRPKSPVAPGSAGGLKLHRSSFADAPEIPRRSRGLIGKNYFDAHHFRSISVARDHLRRNFTADGGAVGSGPVGSGPVGSGPVGSG